MTVRQINDNLNEKMEGISHKEYVITTEIKEYTNVDDDSKYQILDEAQAAYNRTPEAKAYKGSVKERKLHLFDTYKEASKAREKYTFSSYY